MNFSALLSTSGKLFSAPLSWRVIHLHADEANLRFARLIVFGFWFVYYLVTPVELAADFPFALMDHMALVASLPEPLIRFIWNEPTLFGLRLLALVLAPFCIHSRGLRIFGIPLCINLTLLQNVARCFNSNHGEIAPLLAAWILTCCCLLQSAPNKPPRPPVNENFFPLFIICAALTSAYMFAGLHRLLSDPLVIFGNAMKQWAIVGTLKDNFLSPGLGHYAAKYLWLDWLLRGAFLFTTMMELISPLALFHRYFRYFWLISMVGFHLGTLVFMRIFFWENCFLYLLFFESLRWPPRGHLPSVARPPHPKESAT